MQLQRLYIKGLRNIEETDIRGLSSFNFFSGDNGSGKTSILEACSLLSTARSFRSRAIKPLINFNETSCTVFGEVLTPQSSKRKLSCVKDSDESGRYMVDGVRQSSVEQHARSLPLVLIDPQVLSVVDGGPVFRRAFMDWGLFHVEHSFLSVWRRYNRALKQRNALLKTSTPTRDSVALWDRELVSSADTIASMRSEYFDQLLNEVSGIESLDTSFDHKASIQLSHGFETSNYLEQLNESFDKDCRAGFTHSGPHRADIRMRSNRFGVDKVLSRGQQKMLVCDLKIRQAQLFKMQLGYPPVMLLDDIYSELDRHNLRRLLETLISLGAQTFLTSIESPSELAQLVEKSGKELRMFHVERGKIEAI